MKYLLVLSLLISSSFSDEIQRIESIVKDITELRTKYESCQDELSNKSKVVKVETKNTNIEKKNKQKIKKLENQIKKYKKLVKTKDNEIKKLKKLKTHKKVKNKTKACKVKKLDKPNSFPKLILKSKYSKYKTVIVKSSPYRLINDANIYTKIDGRVIEKWTKGTSFTSGEKSISDGLDTWVRITGFFIKGSWVKAHSSMWVKEKYTKKR